MMVNMLGRGANPIVEVANAMAAECRKHYARVNGPLVPPMTVHNCPLDAQAQDAAATFWSGGTCRHCLCCSGTNNRRASASCDGWG